MLAREGEEGAAQGDQNEPRNCQIIVTHLMLNQNGFIFVLPIGPAIPAAESNRGQLVSCTRRSISQERKMPRASSIASTPGAGGGKTQNPALEEPLVGPPTMKIVRTHHQGLLSFFFFLPHPFPHPLPILLAGYLLHAVDNPLELFLLLFGCKN
jgi:hypothetical protein